MTPEQKYIATVSLEHRKMFAQFFTPESIAKFMCNWVMQGKLKSKILEPAYGLGIFSRIIAQSKTSTIDAYEIDSKIFSFAVPERPKVVNLRNEDYFNSDWDSKYDAIVCNPPYLKFHDYNNSSYIPDINRHLGICLSGFTNLYTLFLLKSIAQLQRGGRLAYIIPSEFLNSDYGAEVKRALIKSNTSIHVIIIDFTKCAFDDALTTACILLCENRKSDTIRFSTLTDLNRLDDCLDSYMEYNIKNLDADIKWKAYYEDGNSFKYQHLVPFSNFAKVSRGIATGANDYFTFKQSKIEKFNIPKECLMPCICKAPDASKTFFTLTDFEALANSNKTVYLFNGCVNSYHPDVIRYITLGEQTGINNRYLTASRTPWYSIEKRPPAPIWVSVFNRNGLRFVRNEANIYNLTTFHCIYPKVTIDTDVLFAYLITDVAKEIFLDNSRQYGNGLVKFEPNDLNKGKVADLSLLSIDEIHFIKDTYNYLAYSQCEGKFVALLNLFFEKKFTTGIVDFETLKAELEQLKKDTPIEPEKLKTERIKQSVKQLNILPLFDQDADTEILGKSIVCEDSIKYGHNKAGNFKR